jgi:hypothetical protein
MTLSKDAIDRIYVKASKIPRATTMNLYGFNGYVMNGQYGLYHGNENLLIICFDDRQTETSNK